MTVTRETNRWPKSVYGSGAEPDPRFTLANERTFLAWVRSSIAIIAIGVAINELGVGSNDLLRGIVVVSLITMGVLLAIFSFVRWMNIERAMRLSKPLPSLISGLGLVLFLALIALLAALLTVS
jgi:putative membrane protein